MWELDIKKVECWRIDAFELWCWRLLRVPWTARKSNQSVLKEINPDILWKDWCFKLKLHYVGHLIRRAESLRRPWSWERLRAGGEGGGRGWDGWMASPTQWTWVWANSGKWWRTGEAWCAAVHGVAKSWTQLSDWTTTTEVYDSLSKCNWVTVKQRLLGDRSFWWVTHGFSMIMKELDTTEWLNWTELNWRNCGGYGEQALNETLVLQR